MQDFPCSSPGIHGLDFLDQSGLAAPLQLFLEGFGQFIIPAGQVDNCTTNRVNMSLMLPEAIIDFWVAAIGPCPKDEAETIKALLLACCVESFSQVQFCRSELPDFFGQKRLLWPLFLYWTFCLQNLHDLLVEPLNMRLNVLLPCANIDGGQINLLLAMLDRCPIVLRHSTDKSSRWLD